jgi:CubicO group peptidase (beta-lactamase class C family)
MANYELGVANTPRTKFHVASVSKPFTATAIMLLEERGLLKVDDPLSKYVPDYPNGDRITIHHLLTHTSGIPNVNEFPDYDAKSKFPQTPASLVELFKARPLTMQPGERYSYSNSNYNVLALVVEKVSGRSFGEFLEESVFSVLGMKDTGHDASPARLLANRASGYVPAGVSGLENAPFLDWTVKTGNGSLYSTVEDLYRWDRALYGEKLLKRATLERMFTAHVPNVGYGWFVSKRHDRRAIRMSGRSPGFGAEIQRYVDDDVFVAVLSNNYAGTASTIADNVAAIVFGETYTVPEVVKPVAVAPAVLDAYAGRYEGGEDFFVPNAWARIERRGSDLVMVWSLGAEVTLAPQSETTFLDRPFWGRVTFVKDASGAVTHLVYRSDGREYTAKRVASR